MKVHTSDFKTNISQIGRQLDSKITYTYNGTVIELGKEQLNLVTPHYKADILKSVMKQLDIDSNVNIPIDTVVNYQFGVKVGDDYEYLNYGNYIVNKSEYQADTRSYKIICYDKMLLTMVDYEDIGITYPISIRDYINTICTHFNITFKNSSSTFVNYDKEISSELYLSSDGGSLNYTFRDVLDELAQVTASTICINEDDDELEIRYVVNSLDTIDENFLKNVNVDFGKKYGPINSIVLSRSADADNIFQQDAESIELNGLCELKIVDNQILNGNDRDEYLQEIFNQLNGLEYYLNDYSSTGIGYYNLCDKYIVSINNVNYSCLMLNNEMQVSQGLQENIHTDMPIVTETDYKSADKTDKKINQAYLIVNKVDGEITGVVSRLNNIEIKEGNDYQELLGKFDGYTPKSTTAEIQTSVNTLQTDTYKKTEIQSILKGEFFDENNNQIVSEIVKTTSATFDENGMTYEKSNSNTKTTINEVGIGTKKTDGSDEYILFAGYVDNNNTQYSTYKGQTIVATDNIIVDNYLVVGSHSRFENYENGTGCFFIG